jgi:NADPH2:quinone reductase
MRAVVVHAAGGPEVLKLEEREAPQPAIGEVTIRVRAFGLNRAELFTRRGESGAAVQWPRVIGIECVGEVLEAPGTDLVRGQKVAAMMGGMGRAFDGSYAEQTRVPRRSVFPVDTDLDWATFGALPEMFQTSQGSLTTGLRAQAGDRLFIRGGTSSIGLTVASLAKRDGLTIAATTRNEAKADVMRAAGVDHIVIDRGGSLVQAVGAVFDGGADGVLDLIGTTTLRDSLRCAAPGGRVCMTGMLGGEWIWPAFDPFVDLPNGVFLTSYSGGSEDVTTEQLQAYVDDVAAGRLPVGRDRTFSLDELVEAHRYMEANQAKGKVVVVVEG